MGPAVTALAVLLLRMLAPPSDLDAAALLAAPGAARAKCVVPAGAPTAAARLPDGTPVIARDGALVVGDRVLTPCDGLPGPFPTALAVVNGRLAVGFRGRGVHWYVDGRFAPMEGVPADAAVRALAATGDRLWVGTTGGLLRSDSRGPAARVRHRALGHRAVLGLSARADGGLDVGAAPHHWWRLDRRGRVRLVRGDVFAGCFVRAGADVAPVPPGPGCAPTAAPDPGDGLPSAHVTALVRHHGRLYAGTFDRGLARLDGDGRFTPVPGAPPFVNALLSDGERLWIGTAKGLFVLEDDGTAPRIARWPAGLPSDHVNALARGRDGTLWVATGGGLAGLRGGRVRVIDAAAGLPADIVHAVTVTVDGAVWAGTAAGAARVAPDGLRIFTQASGALPHDWVTALLPDGDGVFAGTYDAGVAYLTPDGRGEPVPGFEGLWINPNGLARVGPALVAATLGDGLVVRRLDRLVAAPIAHRPGTAPLPSDDVTALALYDGAVWIGTRGGLVRWAPAATERAAAARTPDPPQKSVARAVSMW